MECREGVLVSLPGLGKPSKCWVFWHNHVTNAGETGNSNLKHFQSQNCIAGDPLKVSYVKAQFLENHGSAAQYEAGLMYAEDNGWLEVSPARDMFTLTDVGFAKI